MRRLGIRLGLIVAGLAVGALVGEAVLRAAGVAHPVFHRVDPWRGWAPIPGAEGPWRSEGESWIRINAAGLRDRDHTEEKPEGTIRIAVLGDSFTAAFQVPLEKTFWSVLERELSDCPGLGGRTVEVINFGVNNYGTAHELLTLEHHVEAYEPDLVLLALFTGNDVLNNSERLNPGGTGPFFFPSEDGLGLDLSFRETRTYKLKRSWVGSAYYAVIRRSRLVQLLAHARTERQRARQKKAWEASGREGEAGLAYAIYEPPTDPAWIEAWEITERLLRRMHREAAKQGAELWVATLSNPEQVYPDVARREELARRLGVEDLSYPDRRIADLGRREGFGVIRLAPPLASHAAESGEPLHGFDGSAFGHWNEGGHRLAGHGIARQLCRAREGTPGGARKSDETAATTGGP